MNERRRVWSSDEGRIEPKRASKRAPPPVGDGVVRVRRETKGRRGKGVTVVTGVPLEGAALQALAKALKTACGAGGAVKQGRIEIQGEHRDTLIPILEARGWTVRRAGG